ncbi:MAG: prepilin-type N-terminal cleavage/methylation domain-containing protein [Eubacterium sp.]|nr:prepilin-type N-terminal cleavage/methylation domain-containing protein [Eubacterium sp.]
MNRRGRDNRGVTLIELMIAIAILAMLMTAVIMMMSNNSVVYRKTKADINVQTTAQETYAALQDVIMQATDVKIWGEDVAWSTLGEDPDAETGKSKGNYGENPSISMSKGNFQPIKFYPTKMEVQYSIAGTTDTKENYVCTATYYFYRYGKRLNMGENESPRCDIYVKRTYGGAPGKTDDPISGDPTKDTLSSFEDYLLTSSLEDVDFTIDPANQSISLNMKFNDKNMTYNTKGIVGIRNSYVMFEKPEESQLTPSEG